jgi:hypothetical protein
MAAGERRRVLMKYRRKLEEVDKEFGIERIASLK